MQQDNCILLIKLIAKMSDSNDGLLVHLPSISPPSKDTTSLRGFVVTSSSSPCSPLLYSRKVLPPIHTSTKHNLNSPSDKVSEKVSSEKTETGGWLRGVAAAVSSVDSWDSTKSSIITPSSTFYNSSGKSGLNSIKLESLDISTTSPSIHQSECHSVPLRRVRLMELSSQRTVRPWSPSDDYDQLSYSSSDMRALLKASLSPKNLSRDQLLSNTKNNNEKVKETKKTFSFVISDLTATLTDADDSNGAYECFNE